MTTLRGAGRKKCIQRINSLITKVLHNRTALLEYSSQIYPGKSTRILHARYISKKSFIVCVALIFSFLLSMNLSRGLTGAVVDIGGINNEWITFATETNCADGIDNDADSVETILVNYPFEGNANAVGFIYPGTIYGNVLCNVPGYDNTLGCSFPGNVNSFIVLPASLLNVLTDFVISFQMKAASGSTGDAIFSAAASGSGAAANEFTIVHSSDSNVIKIYVKNKLYSFNSPTFRINDGKWHLIKVIRRSNGNVHLFIDGVERTVTPPSTLATGALTVSQIVLGQDQDCTWSASCMASFDGVFHEGGFESDQSYNGLLDNLKVYTLVDKTDCNDTDCARDPACFYGELNCNNGVDDDSDTRVDCADADCTGQTGPNGMICRTPELTCNDYSSLNVAIDNEIDGFANCADSDCNGQNGNRFVDMTTPQKYCEYSRERTCNDGFDNDADGLTDEADPDCQETICNDNTDNDGDGKIDCADSNCVGRVGIAQGVGCTTAGGCLCQATETWAVGSTVCADRFDNDRDTKIDCEDVAGCGSICSSCQGMVDTDADGLIGCADPDCTGIDGSSATGIQACEPGGETRCHDNFDNDGNGLVDCADANCRSTCDAAARVALDVASSLLTTAINSCQPQGTETLPVQDSLGQITTQLRTFQAQLTVAIANCADLMAAARYAPELQSAAAAMISKCRDIRTADAALPRDQSMVNRAISIAMATLSQIQSLVNSIVQACTPISPLCTADDWVITWSECSVLCGGGTQTSSVTRNPASTCSGEGGRPADETRSCNFQPCPTCPDGTDGIDIDEDGIDDCLEPTACVEVPGTYPLTAVFFTSGEFIGCRRGDLNDDGHVTIADYSPWLAAYRINSPASKGNMNDEAAVTIADYSPWLVQYRLN